MYVYIYIYICTYAVVSVRWQSKIETDQPLLRLNNNVIYAKCHSYPLHAKCHSYSLHRIEILIKILWKTKLFDQNQQPLNNVEPFERILRALFIAQCPYKFSSFLDLRNGSSRFRLFARDFRRFDSFSRVCTLSESGPPENLQSWVKYYWRLKVLEKNVGWPNSMRWRGLPGNLELGDILHICTIYDVITA